MTPAFVPGLELSQAFYEEVVAPLIGPAEHSAGLLGGGSEVLGYDTDRSTDHGWGPRVQVFVSNDRTEAELRQRIEADLPDDFRGWPTRFGWDDRPVVHHVEVAQLGRWLEEQLGFDPRAGLSNRDWLTAPQQLLLELTSGAVFYDGLGELEPLRQALEWYPRDIWIWLLACQWRRLDQEEPFVGRTAEVGDQLGSRIVAARLARDLMRLCLLLERRYAPYAKWLGSAFARLDCAAAVGPLLEAALAADEFASREEALVRAFEQVGERHNALGLTAPVDATVRMFYTRQFLVLGSSRFADACLAEVADPVLRSLPLVGSVDQLADSTDVLSDAQVARRLRATYGD